jgi:alginate O-acetyltransferase complex protein AlgJ
MLFLGTFACADRDAELREEFQAAATALAKQRVPKARVIVEGRDGWIIHSGEMKYLRSSSFIGENASRANPRAPAERADPVPVIIDFHRQLQERGIELYLMPIPVRPIIYPESVLGPEPFAKRTTIPNLHFSLQELLGSLREGGVRVFDLTQLFLDEREHPEYGSVFCRSDTHWTPYGISLGARILAAEIKMKPWYEAVPKQRYSQRWRTKKHKGALYQTYEKATGKVLEPDPVQMRRIMIETEDGLEGFGLHHPESPVILIGDSNAARWTPFRSGLPYALAFELGFPIDVLSEAAGGANETRLNLVRKVRAEPGYLEGKRIVVWCFSARTFTNTREGWIPMPL